MDKLMSSIKEEYYERRDTIDGYLIKEQIGYNRDLTLTYNDGNAGIYITTNPFLCQNSSRMYLKLDAYVKILNIRDEIDDELLQRNQFARPDDSDCGKYAWDMGNDLEVKVNCDIGAVEIGYYRICHKGLIHECAGITLCPMEWILFNAVYKNIATRIPKVIEMKHCITNHSRFDGSPTCSLNI